MDVDIIDGVIKVVVLLLSLCSYLDGRLDINLVIFRSIFRGYYVEKNVIELYSELVSVI